MIRYKIQEDLYRIAYFASQKEQGIYLIIDDLQILKDLLNLYDKPTEYQKLVDDYLQAMYQIFKTKFDKMYKGSWDILQKKGLQLSKKLHH